MTHDHSRGWVGDPTEVTAEPATEEAKKWEGFGTGTKPSWEPILVFRKPIAEKTVVANVLKHGTGAINIDGCRIKHSSPEDFEKHKAGVDAIKARGGSMADSWKNSSDLSGASDVTSAGRWPSNTLLVHSDGCELVGSKKVKVGKEGSGKLWSHIRDGKDTHKATESKLGDAEGKESVGVWQCEPGCPAAELDAQSGDRPSTLTGRADPESTHENPGDNHGASWFGGGNSKVYADSGGASRFFAQFDLKVPFIYNAKASKSDATHGGRVENTHPTKKPTSLMGYLVRLVTPPGGVVLDPAMRDQVVPWWQQSERVWVMWGSKETPDITRLLRDVYG